MQKNSHLPQIEAQRNLPSNFLNKEPCECTICILYITPKVPSKAQSQGDSNNLDSFLKMLPSNFPLWIVNTILVSKKESNPLEHQLTHYYNGSKSDNKHKIFKQRIRDLSAIPCANLQLHYEHRECIVPKYEYGNMVIGNRSANQPKDYEKSNIIYMQCYEQSSPVKVRYNRQESCKFFDQILVEHLDLESSRFAKLELTLNQEFLQWTLQEYGEDVFFMYLMEFYSRMYTFHTRNLLVSGDFYWLLEDQNGERISTQIVRTNAPHQRGNSRQLYDQIQNSKPKHLKSKPKLLNVQNLRLQKQQSYYSFQQQFHALLKKQIKSGHRIKKNPLISTAYKGRLERFKEKIHASFEVEQKKALSNIQQEKPFEFQHDSNQIAQMLIPNMGPYKNLRQILNNEEAFMKVFFKTKFQKMLRSRKAQPSSRQISPLKRAHLPAIDQKSARKDNSESSGVGRKIESVTPVRPLRIDVKKYVSCFNLDGRP